MEVLVPPNHPFLDGNFPKPTHFGVFLESLTSMMGRLHSDTPRASTRKFQGEAFGISLLSTRRSALEPLLKITSRKQGRPGGFPSHRATPKSTILMGLSLIKHYKTLHFGVPLFMEIPTWKVDTMLDAAAQQIFPRADLVLSSYHQNSLVDRVKVICLL